MVVRLRGKGDRIITVALSGSPQYMRGHEMSVKEGNDAINELICPDVRKVPHIFKYLTFWKPNITVVCSASSSNRHRIPETESFVTSVRRAASITNALFTQGASKW